MFKRWRRSCVLLVMAAVGYGSGAQGAPAAGAPHYLDPEAVVFSPSGRTLYVLCQGSNELLALDAASGKILRRATVGAHPSGLAIASGGRTLFVSNTWANNVSELDAHSLGLLRTLPTGWGPVGLTTDREGRHLFIANSESNDVSIDDLKTGKELKRLAAWRWPHGVMLSRGGRYVYVSGLQAPLHPYDQAPVSEVTVIRVASLTVARRIAVPNAVQLRTPAEAPRPWPGVILIPEIRPHNEVPIVRVSQGWTLNNAMAALLPREGTTPATLQFPLDSMERGFALPEGLAFTRGGGHILVTSAASNRVAVFDTRGLLGLLGHPPARMADRMDTAARFEEREIASGRDPVAVAVAPAGRFAVVVNRLDDSLTRIDLRTWTTATIPLNGVEAITPRRRGQRLFYSARFAYQGGVACASCHPEGDQNGLAWDLQSRTMGRCRVTVRTLRGIAGTAPFNWNASSPNLETQDGVGAAAIIFRSQGFLGHKRELEDLVAFVSSIPLPPNPYHRVGQPLTRQQRRGKALFDNMGCAGCHNPASHGTARFSVNVGTMTAADDNSCFHGGRVDIPQLEEIALSPPYLHNGEARSLEEIWTKYNQTQKHGVIAGMSKRDLNDLIQYLHTF